MDERVAVDVTQQEVVICSILQAEQLRGKRRNVAGPIHADDSERLNQLIGERYAFGADHLPNCMLDFADEFDPSGERGGQVPEFAQKAVVSGFDAAVCKGLRDMAAL